MEASWANRGRLARGLFNNFYQDKVVKQKFIVGTITKTLEQLIDKGLMVGYGVRTPKKWYIKEVRLTPMGRKMTKRLLGEQQRLPLK